MGAEEMCTTTTRVCAYIRANGTAIAQQKKRSRNVGGQAGAANTDVTRGRRRRRGGGLRKERAARGGRTACYDHGAKTRRLRARKKKKKKKKTEKKTRLARHRSRSRNRSGSVLVPSRRSHVPGALSPIITGDPVAGTAHRIAHAASTPWPRRLVASS